MSKTATTKHSKLGSRPNANGSPEVMGTSLKAKGTKHNSESYFTDKLAASARANKVAAPISIEGLCEALQQYLSSEQIRKVRRAYEYARTQQT